MINYLSNCFEYHNIATKHYKYYNAVKAELDRIRQSSETLNPEQQHLSHQFIEESFISILFESFAVEAYINKTAEILLDGKVTTTSISKGTDTEGKYIKVYSILTDTGLPKKSTEKRKIHQLFDLRNNLVHSHSYLVDFGDEQQYRDAIPFILGDGKKSMRESLDFIMDTFPTCTKMISDAIIQYASCHDNQTLISILKRQRVEGE